MSERHNPQDPAEAEELEIRWLAEVKSSSTRLRDLLTTAKADGGQVKTLHDLIDTANKHRMNVNQWVEAIKHHARVRILAGAAGQQRALTNDNPTRQM